jgi:hypothetical protein
MVSGSQPGARYQLDKVLDYVLAVELAYGVSIHFFLSVERVLGRPAVARVAVGASGSIMDLVPEGYWVRPVEVCDEEPNAIGEAIYYAVLFLEKVLYKIREPIGARPAL